MVIKGFISETKHRFGLILTNYTQAELEELRNSEMWRAGAAVRSLRPERN